MVLPLPLFLSLGFTSNGWLHPALKKQKRKAKTLYLQGKRANADTDPASTLRMNLDPILGEKKEKREENEVNPLGPWRARKGHLGKRENKKEGEEGDKLLLQRRQGRVHPGAHQL